MDVNLALAVLHRKREEAGKRAAPETLFPLSSVHEPIGLYRFYKDL